MAQAVANENEPVSNCLPSIAFDQDTPNMGTDESIKSDTHYLIPGVFIIGRRPTEQLWNTLINTHNINLFITLTEDGIKEYTWLPKYESLDEYKEKSIKYEEFPIEDFHQAPDDKVIEFVERTSSLFLTENGKNIRMYLHCASGHGRTGTIAPLIVMGMYGITAKTSIKWIGKCHEYRHPNQNCTLPETNDQIKQIERLESDMIKIYQKLKNGKNVGGDESQETKTDDCCVTS